MLTNENDMYIFFEVIKEVEPECILDFGMTLMKAGAVSRGMMSESVSLDIKLVGVTSDESKVLPIFREIYDDIIDEEGLRNFSYNRMKKDKTLGIYIGDEADDGDDRLVELASTSSDMKWLLTNNRKFAEKMGEIEPLSVDGNTYYFASIRG